jgi:hypothetical protein
VKALQLVEVRLAFQVSDIGLPHCGHIAACQNLEKSLSGKVELWLLDI